MSNYKERNEIEERQTTNGRSGNKISRGKRNKKGSNTRVSGIDKQGVIPISGCKFNTDNDPSWYGKSAEMLKDSASLAFSTRTGSRLNFRNQTVTTAARTSSVPGICVLNFVPNYVVELNKGDPSSAINVAGKQLYSFVRKANSGATNYSWQDLMITELAADQVFAAIAMGKRAYGIALQYEQKNLYTPSHLLTAMGFDADAVIGNLAQFKWYLDSLINRSKELWVPADMPLCARHYWLNTNIYMDNESAKAQYYLYRQAAFYKYNPTAVATGGALTPVQTPTSLTPATYYEFVNSLMDIIISDDEAGTMMGDIRKAYGEERLYSVAEIGIDYRVVPSYNPEVLLQIHNSYMVDISLGQLPTLQQNQDGNTYLEYDHNYVPSAKYSASAKDIYKAIGVSQGAILNFKGDKIPEPESIMVATRNRAVVEGVSEAPNAGLVILAGSELFTSCDIYQINTATNALFKTTFDSMVYYEANNFNDVINLISTVTMFDWAPIFYVAVYTAPTESAGYGIALRAIIGDLDNYTIIGLPEMDKMHITAMLSELDVPSSLSGGSKLS